MSKMDASWIFFRQVCYIVIARLVSSRDGTRVRSWTVSDTICLQWANRQILRFHVPKNFETTSKSNSMPKKLCELSFL